MPDPRKPTLYELRHLNKKLQTINVGCNGPNAPGADGDEGENHEYALPDEVMANMSPFEQHELRLAVALRKFRDNMQLEEDTRTGKGNKMKLGANAPKLVRLRQALRKEEMDIRGLQNALKGAAKTDVEKSRTKEALMHAGNMRKRYDIYREALQRHQGGGGRGSRVNGDDERSSEPRLYPNTDASSAGAPLIRDLGDDVDDYDFQAPRYDLRQDEEFVLFFDTVAKQDRKIEEALDRILAGTLVLKQNALQINQELKVQAQLLDETEAKVVHVTDRLESLSKRVERTVKDVEKDRIFLYCICFVLLLGLTGFVLYETGVIKKN